MTCMHRDAAGCDYLIVTYSKFLVVVNLRTFDVGRCYFEPQELSPQCMKSIIGTDTCLFMSRSGVRLFNVRTLAFEHVCDLPESSNYFEIVPFGVFFTMVWTTWDPQSRFNLLVYNSKTKSIVFQRDIGDYLTTRLLYDRMSDEGILYTSEEFPDMYVFLSFKTGLLTQHQRISDVPRGTRVFNYEDPESREAHAWPPGSPVAPFVFSFSNATNYNASLFIRNAGGNCVEIPYFNESNNERFINFFFVPHTRTLYVLREYELYVYDLFWPERRAVLATLGDPVWKKLWERDGDDALGRKVFRYFESG